MEDTIYYVQIQNSGDVRRRILENMKDVIKCLKAHEHYKAMRVRKTELMRELSDTLKEISTLSNRLRKVMPKTGLRATSLREVQGKVEIQEEIKQHKTKRGKKKASKGKHRAVAKPAKVPQKKISPVEKLEQELEEIEQKLGYMG